MEIANEIVGRGKPLRIEHDVSIGTYDIDFVGHVSNISYLRWLEDARLKLFETYFPLERFVRDGLTPVLVSTNIIYKRPIRLFEKPVIDMWVSSIGNASLTIDAEICVNGLLTSRVRHVGVFIELATGKPVRLPKVCVRKFQESSARVLQTLVR